ncbi:unnamed protein product [Echinostoma caproni]|uniref:MMS19 nucleotide excision repair protein n=1 Tax=Echinostoma caproni TaxID=27848 RepID=A0A183B6U2_9TREM|nr:unnamed protein product [Echinostoma caproni]
MLPFDQASQVASAEEALLIAFSSAATCTPNSKHLTRLLQLVSRIACVHGDELTTTCLSSDAVQLFVAQLANKKHACFPTASELMSEVLQKVTEFSSDQDEHSANPQSHEPMETDQEDACSSPASPRILFRCLIKPPHPVDFIVHHSVSKPCQFLLQRAPKMLDSVDLMRYAQQLMLLFTEPKIPHPTAFTKKREEPETVPIHNIDTIRVFVANNLQILLHASVHHSDELFTSLTKPVLEFLVTTGLDSLSSPDSAPLLGTKVISRKVSTACWVALFRFVNNLLPRSAHADSKLQTTQCGLSRVLLCLLQTVCKKLGALQADVDDLIFNNIVPQLRHSANLLKNMESKDTLGTCMVQLYAIACLFALSQPPEGKRYFLS